MILGMNVEFFAFENTIIISKALPDISLPGEGNVFVCSVHLVNLAYGMLASTGVVIFGSMENLLGM